MRIDLSINPAKTIAKITSFIKTTVRKADFSRLIIGLSGGVDSSTACYLAVKALGIDKVFILLAPYGFFDKEGIEDAEKIVTELNIPSKQVFSIDIKTMVDDIVSHDPYMSKLRRGNIAVRTRMILLYDLSKKLNALVLGTENKSEYFLGYFTRFGDEAADIEPIRELYKTQVKQLAEYLGISQKIINKSPSANMWLGQTDEGELGFSYEQADKILHLFYDKKYKQSQIIKEGFTKKIVDKVLTRVKDNQFKHKLPYTLDNFKF